MQTDGIGPTCLLQIGERGMDGMMPVKGGGGGGGRKWRCTNRQTLSIQTLMQVNTADFGRLINTNRLQQTTVSSLVDDISKVSLNKHCCP